MSSSRVAETARDGAHHTWTLSGKPAPEHNRSTQTWDQSRLCEPSQNGLSSLVLQPHRLNVPVLGATKRTGSKPVPRCEPSQRGCFLERPQAHHEYKRPSVRSI